MLLQPETQLARQSKRKTYHARKKRRVIGGLRFPYNSLSFLVYINEMIIVDFTDQIIANKENKTLNKPFRTPKGPKKFSVYVKNEKGNIVKVNFGDPNMEIKRDDPARRKSFRARHNCDNAGPKWKARYWSCRQWRAGQKVEGAEELFELSDYNELISINPALALI